MRFLCDEMVGGLGRWLRAAGYDTANAQPGSSDDEVLVRLRGEERLLLTRDRALAQRCRAAEVVLLVGENLEGWAAELRSFGIDWEHRPFSRCLLCNLELGPAGSPTSGIPPDLRAEAVLRCPGCGRHYWEGSHVLRMRERLRRFREGRSGSGKA